MCLGVPGRVLRWLERDPIFALAEVEFDGIRREVHMACTPTALEGDYVIVHAGLSICQIDAQEAERVLAELKQLDLFDSDTGKDSSAADIGEL